MNIIEIMNNSGACREYAEWLLSGKNFRSEEIHMGSDENIEKCDNCEVWHGGDLYCPKCGK